MGIAYARDRYPARRFEGVNGLPPRGANVDELRSHPFFPAGAAVVAVAIAIKPKAGRIRISPVALPLQGPATDCGGVTHAFACFMHGSDAPVLERHRKKNLPAPPMITIGNDTRRDDPLLVFEVDAIGIPAEDE